MTVATTLFYEFDQQTLFPGKYCHTKSANPYSKLRKWRIGLSKGRANVHRRTTDLRRIPIYV